MNFTLIIAAPALLLGLVTFFGLPEAIAFWTWILTITAAAVFVMADILTLISHKLSSHLTEQERQNFKELLSIGAITLCAVATRSLASNLLS